MGRAWRPLSPLSRPWTTSKARTGRRPALPAARQEASEPTQAPGDTDESFAAWAEARFGVDPEELAELLDVVAADNWPDLDDLTADTASDSYRCVRCSDSSTLKRFVSLAAPRSEAVTAEDETCGKRLVVRLTIRREAWRCGSEHDGPPGWRAVMRCRG